MNTQHILKGKGELGCFSITYGMLVSQYKIWNAGC